jgi:hypothetical protein
MILSEIRDYVRERGQVSLRDIALHFDSDPAAVRSMLERWIRKGKVLRRSLSAGCGGNCNQCDPSATEVYVWQEGATPESAPLTRDLHCPR